MKYFGWLIATFAAALASEPSWAQCSLASFDRAQPAALTGSVDLNGESFSYGSDVDHVNNHTTVWNYVENKSQNRNLIVSWPKGLITLNIFNPLGPGAVACKVFTVAGTYNDDVDYDATLKYGSANYEQPASVYAPRATDSPSPSIAKSTIDVNYVDNSTIKDVHIESYFEIEDGKIVSANISATGGYYIGISSPDNIWSDATKYELLESAKLKNIAAGISEITSFGGDPSRVRAFLNYASVPEGQMLYVNGPLENFAIGERASSMSPADIVVFDSDRKPILRSQIALPNTKIEQ
ncbi:hypothetical protein [Mesorhizobium captivum]|uniref:hypothetical protein n=1 Tax=Mesorhizobium captivum TaxID=3072319 RepID=UPI002A24E65F|nr:hypothetical protein [Mesorhizobium sp. VK23E]MDX8515852.1 hypothetical protein [Mesorhizobium sp. VK23E]